MSLAESGPAVLVLVGRSRQKCQPVVDAIARASPSTSVRFVEADLSSLASVRRAAQAILDDGAVPAIDVVINNAAVMMCPLERTPEGNELQFATGHLGHFLLTNLLMPKLLRRDGSARIVNVSSSGNKMGGIRWADPNFDQAGSYSPIDAYGQAKTANVLFSVALNARLAARGAARAFALHPGSIATGLQVHMTPEIRDEATKRLFAGHEGAERPPLKTLQQGCATTLRAALDPDLPAHEGVFLNDCQLTTPSECPFLAEHAVVPEDAERLWDLSEKLVGQKFEF